MLQDRLALLSLVPTTPTLLESDVMESHVFMFVYEFIWFYDNLESFIDDF